MNILPPLLLDRSCLVNKISKLSPMIDHLEWINNDKAFQAYWRFYANGCKKRQQDIRQRIEQNTDFVQHIKSEKAATFFNLLTQNNPSLVDNLSVEKISKKDATNTVYDEFLECFRSPLESKSKEKRCKLEKLSPYFWEREAKVALNRLSMTRNPYDVAQLTEKLEKIKQLQSLIRGTPYSDRFLKPILKYTTSNLNKASVQADIKVYTDKRKEKLKSKLEKKTSVIRELNEENPENDPRNINYLTEGEEITRQQKNRPLSESRKFSGLKEPNKKEDNITKENSSQSQRKFKKKTIREINKKDFEIEPRNINYLTEEEETTKQQRSKHLGKSRNFKEIKEPHEKEDNSTEKESIQESKLKIPEITPEQQEKLREYSHKKENVRPIKKSKLKEEYMKHIDENYPDRQRTSFLGIPIKKRSLKKHKSTHSMHSQKWSSKRNSFLDDDSEQFKKWYKEFAKHKSKYGKSRLRSSVNPDQIKQYQRSVPKLMKYVDNEDSLSIKSIKEPDFRPYQSAIDLTTKMDEPSGRKRRSKTIGVSEKVLEKSKSSPRITVKDKVKATRLHKINATFKPTLADKESQPRDKSLTKILSEKSFTRPVLKYRSKLLLKPTNFYQRKGSSGKSQTNLKTKRYQNYPLNDPVRKSIGAATFKSRHSSQIHVRDMSKWDKLFRPSLKSEKSINLLKTDEDGNELVDEYNNPLGFKLNFLDKNVIYKNPYGRSSFISHVCEAFGQASLDIRNQRIQRSSTLSLPKKLSTTSIRSQPGLRKLDTPSDIKLRLEQRKNINPKHYLTDQKVPEPEPLYVDDLVADFLKNSSIEALFKATHPERFNPPVEAKPKEPTKIKPRKSKILKVTKPIESNIIKRSQLSETCLNCCICKQLNANSSKQIPTYMRQIQNQRKKHELRLYYKQMKLQNCQMVKKRQARKDSKNQLCPDASNLQIVSC